jgi:hypothetical protein
MPRPRCEQISLTDTPYYHIISRCVRRTFLCVQDDVTGKSFEDQECLSLARLWRLCWVSIDLVRGFLATGGAHVLARVLLRRFAGQQVRAIKAFAPDAVQAIEHHTWPGNVREMENWIKREGFSVPTLLNEKGFKFFFYANEHPPAHVHVMKSDGWAKIEMETSVVVYSTLKKQELKECLELLDLHRQQFLEVWNAWFGR